MSELLTIRKTCRLCGSAKVVCSVPLAKVPIVSPNVGQETAEDGSRLTTVVAPLDNYLCEDCGLVQLMYIVDPALIYRNYLYRTNISLGLSQHFRKFSETVISRVGLKPGDLVVEFGSNDGTLLGHFRDAGLEVQGIDPAKQIAAEATFRGLPTRADFFGPEVAKSIREERGLARAVICNNAMANIDDLVGIMQGVKEVLAPDGAFIFETQYALDVYQKTLLDVIYHEHISIFSVRPVAKSFPAQGLEVFDAETIETKGGSIRFWLQHVGGPRRIEPRVNEMIENEYRQGMYDLAFHKRFSDKVANIKSGLHELIANARASGRPIAAYGTSVGCAALIHQFELEDKLDMLFDDTPFKQRLNGPGYDLPVYTADGVLQHNPALIIVLAWRYAAPITAKHDRYIRGGGRFIVPLPEISQFP